MHQRAWKPSVGQTGTPGLEEAWGDAGQPFCSRDASGEEGKKKRNQCLFLLEKIALCTLLVFSYY